MGSLTLASWLLIISLGACTATQGQTLATVLTEVCKGGMIVMGEPGLDPLCVAPEMIEKFWEATHPPAKPGMALPPPMTPEQRYAVAKALGAQPIKVK